MIVLADTETETESETETQQEGLKSSVLLTKDTNSSLGIVLTPSQELIGSVSASNSSSVEHTEQLMQGPSARSHGMVGGDKTGTNLVRPVDLLLDSLAF